MEWNRMIEQERIWDVILRVALQVKNDSELVVNQVLISQLLEFVACSLPKLWEPDGWHEDPGARLRTSLDQSYWIIFLDIRDLLVRVVKLLSQWILDEVEFANRCMNIRTDISIFQIACSHSLQSLISLLIGLHACSRLIQQIVFDDAVGSDIDASFLLEDNLVRFLVSPYHVQSNTIVLCDWAYGVYHVHMTDGEQSNGVLPGGSAQELMQSRVLLWEIEHLRELLINELSQFGFELMIWAQESKAYLMNQGQILELGIFEQFENVQRSILILELLT